MYEELGREAARRERGQQILLTVGQWFVLTNGLLLFIFCVVGAVAIFNADYSDAPSEDVRMIRMITALMLSVGLLVGLLNWRYWTLVTRYPPVAVKRRTRHETLDEKVTRWLTRLNQVATEYEPLWKMTAALFIPVLITVLSIAVTVFMAD